MIAQEAVPVQIEPPLWPASVMADAISSAGIGLWEHDLREDRLRGDRAMAALTGLSQANDPHGIAWAHVAAAIHADDRDFVRSRWRPAMDNNGIVCVEFRVASASSAGRWILVRGQYATGVDGRQQGRGVVMDVTASRQRAAADVPIQSEAGADAEALDRAAEHALAARRAIDDLGVPGLLLRPAVDALLLEIGRLLSGKNGPSIPIER